jgi:hypothetical protein
LKMCRIPLVEDNELNRDMPAGRERRPAAPATAPNPPIMPLPLSAIRRRVPAG